MRGRWDYADAGLLDHTHIRFFTLDTAVEMFQKAGWTVLDATPRILWNEKTNAALTAFLPLAEVIGVAPEKLQRDISAVQWVIRAINGPAPKILQIVGVGLAKVAGCNEARIDYPLASLNTIPKVRAAWGENSVKLPQGEPGVLIYQRRYFADYVIDTQVESLIQAGYVVVIDVDDDPRGKEWAETDFYAFKRVHAVTVSTEAIASVVRNWNPNVMVFQNAIFELPDVRKEYLHSDQLKIFFGALNRETDWEPIMASVIEAALAVSSKIEFVVVHDKRFFDRIPESILKSFHSTLSHKEYLGILSVCDIALLPLADTEFNRMKSDLKLIECAACNVVPICSPTVYADNPDHAQLAIFASSPDDWRRAIITLCTDTHMLKKLCSKGYDYIKTKRMHAYQVDNRHQYYSQLKTELPALEMSRLQRMQSLKWRPSPHV